MTRRRWPRTGLLGILVLIGLLAGCAKQVPIEPLPGDGDRGTDSRGLPDSGDQPQMVTPGQLNERDRAMEGRMSGADHAMDAEAAREAFVNLDILFAYDSFTLTDAARQLLEQKAEWLTKHPEVSVQLEGHCDERGTVAYNLALGERRANAVRQYLTALGVRPNRLTTVSYGEEFPLDPGHGEAAWARNRRAHFAILNP